MQKAPQLKSQILLNRMQPGVLSTVGDSETIDPDMIYKPPYSPVILNPVQLPDSKNISKDEEH